MKFLNIRNFSSWADVLRVAPDAFYCGRASAYKGIAKDSPLCNPYSEKTYGREGCIQKFKVDLWKRIKEGDPQTIQALKSLTSETTLVCWCVPLPCHTQVIENAWVYCKTQGII